MKVALVGSRHYQNIRKVKDTLFQLKQKFADDLIIISGGAKDGKNDTANFVSGLVGSLPPLHQITKNVGIELPEFLGKLSEDPAAAAKMLEQAKNTSAEESGKKKSE